MTKAPEEVARLFGSAIGSTGNFSTEVYPCYPGLVVARGELRSMVWGFPLTLKSKKTGQPLKPKPVNNARADKLDSFMWRYSFAERRCLIPITKFAEAEGNKGSMTRTWLSLPDQDTFAVAGTWRDTDEWGCGLFDGDDGRVRVRYRRSRSHAGGAAARRLGAMGQRTSRGSAGAMPTLSCSDDSRSHK